MFAAASLGLTRLALALPLPRFGAEDTACSGGAGLKSVTDSAGKVTCQPVSGSNLTELIHNVVNILLYVIGVGSIIMIVIGGLQYVFSSGDATSTKNAKNTILYAVIGVIIAVLSYAIVAFIVGQLT